MFQRCVETTLDFWKLSHYEVGQHEAMMIFSIWTVSESPEKVRSENWRNGDDFFNDGTKHNDLIWNLKADWFPRWESASFFRFRLCFQGCNFRTFELISQKITKDDF